MSVVELEAGQIFTLIRRNAAIIILSLLLGGMLGWAALLLIPAKFKARAVLSIEPSYFQNALLGSIIYQSNDPAEQSALRISLLRRALTDEYLDELGTRYRFFRAPLRSQKHLMERAQLLKQIEYFSTNSTAFQIAVVANDPYVALAMLKDVLGQMLYTLTSNRRNTLLQMQRALDERVRELVPGLAESSIPVSALERDNLKNELSRIQAQIAILKSQYTERHPEVARLEERARLLRGMLRDGVVGSGQSAQASSGSDPASRGAKQDLLDDLTKKLNYLTLVLATEKNPENVNSLSLVERPSLPLQPFFPPPAVVLLCGVLGGSLLAAILVTYRELTIGTFLSPELVAERLGVPLLGELPPLPGRKRLQLPQAPGAEAILQQLPSEVGEG